jgi:benzoate membrane transport protein
MGLSGQRTSAWIALVYGLPMLPSLVLSVRYRVPLLLTGNVFALIFFASLGDRFSFGELAAAAILAGAILLVTAVLGLTERLASWIPAPIVFGLIAGAIMPFFVGIFSSITTSDASGDVPIAVPIMVASAVIAYLLTQRILGPRVPPILPAFLVGLVLAAVGGQLGSLPSRFSLPHLHVVGPEFSWTVIVTVTPVLLALMTVQSNVPSLIYLGARATVHRNV